MVIKQYLLIIFHWWIFSIFQLFICPICSCSLDGVSNYLKHVNRHKTTTEHSRLHQFDCPICSASHATISDLRKHFTSHHSFDTTLVKRKRVSCEEAQPIDEHLSRLSSTSERMKAVPQTNESHDDNAQGMNLLDFLAELKVLYNSNSQLAYLLPSYLLIFRFAIGHLPLFLLVIFQFDISYPINSLSHQFSIPQNSNLTNSLFP